MKKLAFIMILVSALFCLASCDDGVGSYTIEFTRTGDRGCDLLTSKVVYLTATHRDTGTVVAGAFDPREDSVFVFDGLLNGTWDVEIVGYNASQYKVVDGSIVCFVQRSNRKNYTKTPVPYTSAAYAFSVRIPATNTQITSVTINGNVISTYKVEEGFKVFSDCGLVQPGYGTINYTAGTTTDSVQYYINNAGLTFTYTKTFFD